MKHPLTYRQWAKQSGQPEEIGAKVLVADKLLRDLEEANLSSMIVPRLAEAISKGFINFGVEPFAKNTNLELWTEDDIFLRAKEFGTAIDGIQGKRPLQYLSVAYQAWQEAQKEVDRWEKMSLSEYLQHWLFHKKRGKKQAKLVQELLDKINPEWVDD